MAKAPGTRKPKARRLHAAGHKGDPTFHIIIDGHRYPVWFDEATARDVADLRDGGYHGGLLDLGRALANGTVDLDDVAALVWLSRRQTGEPRLPLGVVLDAISYDNKYELEFPENDDDEDDGPEIQVLDEPGPDPMEPDYPEG